MSGGGLVPVLGGGRNHRGSFAGMVCRDRERCGWAEGALCLSSVDGAMNERTSTRPPPHPAPPLVPTQGRGVKTERGSISYGKYSARGHFAAVRGIAQGSRSGARTGQ